MPPDINHSHYRFVPTDRQHIRYALGAIKGTGEAAVEHLIAEREAHGPFVDLFDFCRRTDKRIVNRRAIETMIRAGAFDGLDDNRAKLLANVELAMSLAEQAAANINQGGLFDDFDDSVAPPVEMKRAGLERSATPGGRKLAIGFICPAIRSRPMPPRCAVLSKTLASLSPKKEPQTLAGVVTPWCAPRWAVAARWFCAAGRRHRQARCVFVLGSLRANRHKLREDALLIVEGKVSYDDFSGGLRIVVDSVLELAEAQSRFAQGLALSLHAESDIGKLKHLLQPFAGSGPAPALSLCRQPGARRAGRRRGVECDAQRRLAGQPARPAGRKKSVEVLM